MRLAHKVSRRTHRAAFTLVELLVVIAIIIVLASLLLAAVFKALDLANEAATRTDITQLSAAVESFKTKYQVSYAPSRIILCADYLNYFQGRNPANGIVQIAPGVPSQLHTDSLDYLQRVFPRITTGDAAPAHGGLPRWAVPSPNPDPFYFVGIDWSGQGLIFDREMTMFVNIGGTVVQFFCRGSLLEGHQCLVFFTGGIPQPNPDGTYTMTGFSTNATNPAQLGGDRVAPFFDFKSNRLRYWFGANFPSYNDGYGKIPYAYFSSYKTANGYNRYVNYSNPYLPPPNPLPPYSPPAQVYYSDCQTLRFPAGPGEPQGLWPYAQSWAPTNQYLNSQTFQIISAGKNLQFGLGTYPPFDPNYPAGAWTPSQAGVIYSQGSLGYDDIANFYDRLLGVPTQ